MLKIKLESSVVRNQVSLDWNSQDTILHWNSNVNWISSCLHRNSKLIHQFRLEFHCLLEYIGIQI